MSTAAGGEGQVTVWWGPEQGAGGLSPAYSPQREKVRLSGLSKMLTLSEPVSSSPKQHGLARTLRCSQLIDVSQGQAHRKVQESFPVIKQLGLYSYICVSNISSFTF